MTRVGVRLGSLVCLVAFGTACSVHKAVPVKDPSSLPRDVPLLVAEVATKSGDLIRFSPAGVLEGGEVRSTGDWTRQKIVTLARAEVESVEYVSRKRIRLVRAKDGEVYRADGVLEDSPARVTFLVRESGRDAPETITLQRLSDGPLAWGRSESGQTVATGDGMEYAVAKVLRDEEDSVTFEGWPTIVRLPLSDIRELKAQQLEAGKTTDMTCLGVAGAALALVVIGAIALATGGWSTVERARPAAPQKRP